MAKQFPELETLREILEAEKAEIVAESAHLHVERQELLERIQPLEGQLREVNQRITSAEQPRLTEIGMQIAAIARAMGAKSLTAD